MQPKSRKFRKDQKRLHFSSGGAQRPTRHSCLGPIKEGRLLFGSHGLMALESCSITAPQLEAARRSISRRIKKGGRLWLRCLAGARSARTQKATKTRMGKGKGAVQFFSTNLERGDILLELAGSFSTTRAKAALLAASHKLPLKLTPISALDPWAPLV